MNQIATLSERKPSIQAGGSIVSIVPQNLDEAFRLSTAIHQAGMAPYGIDTPQKIMIAMLAGLELGMPPMQGVQSIAVINNRPCMWGDGLIGVVKNSGVCQYVKEWVEGDGDSRIAFCETKRRGEDDPVRRSFSADDAKRAGLWQTEPKVKKKSRDGGFYEKDNDSPWYRYPQRMLQMRARAWCLRDVYPDVLKGMQSREEVEDYAHGQPAEPQQPTLAPLEERLRIAPRSAVAGEQSAEGFDRGFVSSETAALTSGAEIDQEPSDASLPSGAVDAPVVDQGAEASPSAPDLSGDEPETKGDEAPAKAVHGEQSASSPGLNQEERDWLRQATKMLWAATGKGEQDVLAQQKKAVLAMGIPEAVRQDARDRLNSIFNKCKLVCFGERDTGEVLLEIAMSAGCEPKEIV